MAGKKLINDYAAEYEDCMEILENELPEYDDSKPKLIKPKITQPKPFNVFGEQEPWFDMEEHWQDMPEFGNKKIKGERQLIVEFYTEEDFEDFCKLIGQEVPKGVKTISHPKREQAENILNAWIGEDEE